MHKTIAPRLEINRTIVNLRCVLLKMCSKIKCTWTSTRNDLHPGIKWNAREFFDGVTQYICINLIGVTLVERTRCKKSTSEGVVGAETYVPSSKTPTDGNCCLITGKSTCKSESAVYSSRNNVCNYRGIFSQVGIRGSPSHPPHTITPYLRPFR